MNLTKSIVEILHQVDQAFCQMVLRLCIGLRYFIVKWRHFTHISKLIWHILNIIIPYERDQVIKTSKNCVPTWTPDADPLPQCPAGVCCGQPYKSAPISCASSDCLSGASDRKLRHHWLTVNRSCLLHLCQCHIRALISGHLVPLLCSYLVFVRLLGVWFFPKLRMIRDTGAFLLANWFSILGVRSGSLVCISGTTLQISLYGSFWWQKW